MGFGLLWLHFPGYELSPPFKGRQLNLVVSKANWSLSFSLMRHMQLLCNFHVTPESWSYLNLRSIQTMTQKSALSELSTNQPVLVG